VRGKEFFCLVAKILTFERGKSRDFCSTRVAAQMGGSGNGFWTSSWQSWRWYDCWCVAGRVGPTDSVA